MPGYYTRTEFEAMDPLVSRSAVDLAWAAGVLDCDGHIGRHWQKPNPKRREINGRWRMVVAVTGTILPIPERMKELFGGSVHYRRTTADRPVGYWTVTQGSAAAVLIEVIPYLVGKKEAAQQLLTDYLQRKAC